MWCDLQNTSVQYIHFEAGFAAFPNQPTNAMHEEQIAPELQSKQSKIAP